MLAAATPQQRAVRQALQAMIRIDEAIGNEPFYGPQPDTVTSLLSRTPPAVLLSEPGARSRLADPLARLRSVVADSTPGTLSSSPLSTAAAALPLSQINNGSSPAEEPAVVNARRATLANISAARSAEPNQRPINITSSVQENAARRGLELPNLPAGPASTGLAQWARNANSNLPDYNSNTDPLLSDAEKKRRAAKKPMADVPSANAPVTGAQAAGKKGDSIPSALRGFFGKKGQNGGTRKQAGRRARKTQRRK